MNVRPGDPPPLIVPRPAGPRTRPRDLLLRLARALPHLRDGCNIANVSYMDVYT